PMLRRPFSIGGLRRSGSTSEIELIGRVVGRGTAWLNALEAGDHVDILGPLGRGFTPPPPGNKALLLAGGVGWPPIRWWGRVLRERHHDCEMIYWAQSRDTLPVRLCDDPSIEGGLSMCMEEFAAWGIPAMITTDDGSCGLKGRVTNGLLRYFTHSAHASRVSVYACGPLPMLRAAASICAKQGVPCELAMERVMACGMATCQSCVLPVCDQRDGAAWHYALCCTDGPVFDAHRVAWPMLR
ncbi:MAG: dihydroorotate dehydrogenase electron transfer subunit, partial [Methyloligellaceae bacterium]